MRLLRIVHLHMGGFSSCIWQKRMQQCGPGVSDLEIENVHATDRINFVRRALNTLSCWWLATGFGAILLTTGCVLRGAWRQVKMKGTKFDERG